MTQLPRAPSAHEFFVHQTWKTTQIPEKWRPSHEGCLELCRQENFVYVLWTDDMNRKLIQVHYPWFLKTYDAYPKAIMKADAARYFFLHRFGGLYLDLDEVPNVPEWTRFIRYARSVTSPPFTFLGMTKSILIDQPYTNAVMLSVRPRDTFWSKVWDFLQNPFGRKAYKKALSRLFPKHFDVIYRTGPGVVNDASHLRPVRAIPKSLLFKINKNDTETTKLCTHLEGDSWMEGSDRGFLRFLENFWRNRDYFLWPLGFIFFVLFWVFFGLWLKLAKARNVRGR